MKMKPFIKVAICIGCCVAVICTTGCSWSFNIPPRTEETTEYVTSGIEESTTSATESQAAEPETTTANSSAALSQLGIPNDLKVENNATITKGNWGAFYVWNYDTDSAFTVYMKVDKVTTASEDSKYVKSSMEEYNKEVSESRQLTDEDLKNYKNVEYAVADVNLYIPAGQNVKNYMGVPLPLSISLKGNGSWKDKSGTTYIFTSNVQKQKQGDKKFSAGDTCQTKLIYPILMDTTTPYGFECSYQTPSNDGNYNKITFELKS